MAGALKVSDVFVPGRLPELTYNPRTELHLEQRLEDYLDEGGAILTVAGPTKTGKSVLLRRVIANPVWVDGQGVTGVDHLWSLAADQLGVYTQVEFGSGESETGGGVGGTEVGLGPVLKVKGDAQYSASDSTSRRYMVDRPLVAVAKQAVAAAGRPLVIDDFHFIPRPTQREIVRALKPLVLAGVPVIFVSISHRVQDVVSAEPDMTGRVVPLQVEFWSDQELFYIAERGFEALNVRDSGGGTRRPVGIGVLW